MKNKPFVDRLGFAFSGVLAAWQHEKSFRIQVVMAILTLPLMVWLDPGLMWWVVMIILGALVLAAELFNTALEHLIDHLHPEVHPSVKLAKDCAAAAVLVLSVAVLIVAACMVWDVLG